MSRSLSFVLLLLMGTFLVSCSTESKVWRFPNVGTMRDQSFEDETQTKSAPVKPLPWEAWPTKFQLRGGPIEDPMMLAADGIFDRGGRKEALEAWRKINPASLSLADREARALRIASTELALDDPQKSLRTVSDFFRTTGRGVDETDVRFSIVLAYAYGRKKDIDQSLAWFSRVNQISGGGGMTDAAAQGVDLLFRSLGDDQLIEVGQVWATDAWIHSLVGRERERRRRQGNLVVASGSFGDALWSGKVDTSTYSSLTSSPTGTPQIAVMLPLSGKYAALGRSLRNGIELALEGERKSGTLDVAYHDTKGEVTTSEQITHTVIAQGRASVILGPLLADPALAVSEIARSRRFPVVAFTKRSDFSPGGSVFRLGVTVESQVESLLSTVRVNPGLKRFAIVRPETPAGIESAAAFRRALQVDGLDVVYETSFFPNDFTGLVEIAREIEGLNVDGVFVPDDPTGAARLFASFSPAVRRHIVPLGTASWDNSAELKQSRTALDGAIFTSPFFTSGNKVLVKRFIETYHQRYNAAPDFLAAQGFDGATMVLAALRHLREGDGDFARAFLEINTYEGLTGTIAVHDDGEVTRSLSVVELKKGVMKELSAVPTRDVVIMKGNTEVPVDLTGGER